MKTLYNMSRYIVVSILLSVFCTSVFAQSGLQKAQKAAANYEYSKAIELYNEYLKTPAAKPYAIRDLVNCYMMTGNTKTAEEWMLKLITSNNYTNADIFTYAKILKSNGKYKEAKTEFLKYSDLEPSEKNNITKWVNSCQKSIERMDGDSVFFEAKNIGSLNSINSEFGLIKIGKEYYFSSDRQSTSGTDKICEWTGNPFMKIYSISGNIIGTLSAKPILIDSLNSDFHNGQASYDSISKTLYFTRTKIIKVKQSPINNDPTYWNNNFDLSGYENRLEIYSAKYDNGKWINIKPFEYNNTEYSVGHPALSPDGKTLYFSSDMPGGYGSTDIYYCEWVNGKWSTPVNAGSTINTDSKEVFPYVDNNGILYFASDNIKGMGGLDIYYTKGSKNKWSSPRNMGYPINSSKDDFSILITKQNESGFFSSNRDGGVGEDDIYSYSLIPNRQRILVIRTFELQKDNSLVELTNLKVRIKNDESKYKKVLKSDKNGIFTESVDFTTPFVVSIMKNGYNTQSKTIKVKNTDGDTIYVDLITKKAEGLILKGKTKELFGSITNPISNIQVIIENIEDEFIDSLKSDSKGEFTSKLDINKTYMFTAVKDGYYTQTKTVTIKEGTRNDSVNIETITYTMKDGVLAEDKTNYTVAINDTANIEILLNKIVIDQSIIVNNIYYDYNKSDIRPDAAKELDNIVQILKDNPNISIELSSHTDSRGSDYFNAILSQKRAESAVKYIVSKGIDKKRLTAKGYGETKLINKCYNNFPCTEEQHQMNRRTEIKVIKVK